MLWEEIKMARKIAVWNMKGGVGKTTTVVNVGYLLAQTHRVLLVDLDLQQNTASYYGGHLRKYNLWDVSRVYAQKKKNTIRQAISRTYLPTLKILAASSVIRDEQQEIQSLLGENFLGELLKEVEADFDYILLDCHPDYGPLTKEALQYADDVLVPILLDGYSRDNLNLVREQINRTNNLRVCDLQYYIFANRVRNTRSQLTIYRDLLEKHDYPIMDTCIAERAAVQNALALKKPVALHRKKDQATADFRELAKEIEKLAGGEKR